MPDTAAYCAVCEFDQHRRNTYQPGDQVTVDIGGGFRRPGVVVRVGLDPTVTHVFRCCRACGRRVDPGRARYMVRLADRHRPEPFHAYDLRPGDQP